jgi:hypothetical protein
MNKGDRITFKSEFKTANGTWEVYNRIGANVYLARVLKNGSLAAPHAKTLLALDDATINGAIAAGNASRQ